jgi:restriction system protein
VQPVQPTVAFDSLLTRFKFVAGMDVIAGLDSRPDLLAMAPYDFEHLVRQIFEEMGMQAWNTEAIKDDGEIENMPPGTVVDIPSDWAD